MRQTEARFLVHDSDFPMTASNTSPQPNGFADKLADGLADPRLRQRAAYGHWIHEHVRWSDTDMAGHANNLAFAAFAETGRAILLRRFMAPDTAHRALLVLGEFRIKYLSEAYWPAEVEVGTGVSAIGTRSCKMVQGLFIGEHCIAVAESGLVLIDETTRKSADLPPVVRALLQEHAIQLPA